jgi:hypothetical protein
MRFQRPTGASADVSELEFVSALHQTDMAGVRPDGSIQGAFKSSQFVLSSMIDVKPSLQFIYYHMHSKE